MADVEKALGEWELDRGHTAHRRGPQHGAGEDGEDDADSASSYSSDGYDDTAASFNNPIGTVPAEQVSSPIAPTSVEPNNSDGPLHLGTTMDAYRRGERSTSNVEEEFLPQDLSPQTGPLSSAYAIDTGSENVREDSALQNTSAGDTRTNEAEEEISKHKPGTIPEEEPVAVNDNPAMPNEPTNSPATSSFHAHGYSLSASISNNSSRPISISSSLQIRPLLHDANSTPRHHRSNHRRGATTTFPTRHHDRSLPARASSLANRLQRFALPLDPTTLAPFRPATPPMITYRYENGEVTRHLDNEAKLNDVLGADAVKSFKKGEVVGREHGGLLGEGRKVVKRGGGEVKKVSFRVRICFLRRQDS